MTETKCKVEVFSRVVGFFRPVQSWNKGKTEEFKDRKMYRLDADLVNVSPKAVRQNLGYPAK